MRGESGEGRGKREEVKDPNVTLTDDGLYDFLPYSKHIGKPLASTWQVLSKSKQALWTCLGLAWGLLMRGEVGRKCPNLGTKLHLRPVALVINFVEFCHDAG